MQPNDVASSRLSPIEELSLEPFVRASMASDISLYWIPVSQFPMLPPQRDWLYEFHRRLADWLKRESGLRQECFLQFKSLYPGLLNRFSETSNEYIPLTGASLTPGAAPPELPDFETVKKQVEAASKTGTPLNVNQWMPDHLHWFLKKKADAQRADFLGHGGMLTLYISPDPDTMAPVFEMPLFIKSLPCYSENDQDDIQSLYSMKDKFLAQSKKVFGEPFQKDPSYEGLMFVLPLFTGESLLSATPEQRSQWFGVFDGYFIESKADRGMLLALKDSEFDESLMILLKGMKEDGFVYRA